MDARSGSLHRHYGSDPISTRSVEVNDGGLSALPPTLIAASLSFNVTVTGRW